MKPRNCFGTLNGIFFLAICICCELFSPSALGAEAEVTSVCALVHDPAHFNGRQVSVSTFFESDGLEWQVLVDLSCKGEALRVVTPGGTKGLDELKAAVLKGRRGTIDKTVTATFFGTFKWVPGEVPYRALVVNEIRDLSVKPGPSPFLKGIGVVDQTSHP